MTFGYGGAPVLRDVGFAIGAGRAGGAVRPERRGQVDAAASAAGPARAVGGAGDAGGDAAGGAVAAPDRAPRGAAAAGRAGGRSAVRPRGGGARPAAAPRPAAGRDGGRRRGGGARAGGDRHDRAGRAAARPSCRAASGTACTWRARWRRRRRCCCSTSRSRGSTSRTSSRRWTCCARPSTAGVRSLVALHDLALAGRRCDRMLLLAGGALLRRRAARRRADARHAGARVRRARRRPPGSRRPPDRRRPRSHREAVVIRAADADADADADVTGACRGVARGPRIDRVLRRGRAAAAAAPEQPRSRPAVRSRAAPAAAPAETVVRAARSPSPRPARTRRRPLRSSRPTTARAPTTISASLLREVPGVNVVRTGSIGEVQHDHAARLEPRSGARLRRRRAGQHRGRRRRRHLDAADRRRRARRGLPGQLAAARSASRRWAASSRSRRARPGQARATARTGMGSFGTMFGDVSGGGRVGRLRLYAGVHGFFAQGDFPYLNDNGTVVQPRRRRDDAAPEQRRAAGRRRAARRADARRAGARWAWALIGVRARRRACRARAAFPTDAGAASRPLRGLGYLRYESRDDLGPGGRLSAQLFASRAARSARRRRPTRRAWAARR